ncbi:CLUMA_CG013783, isoform A [Clunio marinus]|uniref:CLUMA_CG013783, isoform A n=1 Tax=Clunio marinus TaxID=568069 RepID=A0A1J1IL84_9DIPT|nr:CLUMA_CG013783, isoform A [Clunio marinus]
MISWSEREIYEPLDNLLAYGNFLSYIINSTLFTNASVVGISKRMRDEEVRFMKQNKLLHLYLAFKARLICKN